MRQYYAYIMTNKLNGSRRTLRMEYTDAAMNLRSYYPDFFAVDDAGSHWILETKGQETPDVARKDAAAGLWCENATKLTNSTWKYAKIPQKEFESLQLSRLADLTALQR